MSQNEGTNTNCLQSPCRSRRWVCFFLLRRGALFAVLFFGTPKERPACFFGGFPQTKPYGLTALVPCRRGIDQLDLPFEDGTLALNSKSTGTGDGSHCVFLKRIVGPDFSVPFGFSNEMVGKGAPYFQRPSWGYFGLAHFEDSQGIHTLEWRRGRVDRTRVEQPLLRPQSPTTSSPFGGSP